LDGLAAASELDAMAGAAAAIQAPAKTAPIDDFSKQPLPKNPTFKVTRIFH
jgi:hypothetical protein